MLTQEKADALLAMPKRLVTGEPIEFPMLGETEQLLVGG